MINYLNTNAATLTANSATIQINESIDFSIVNDGYLCAVSNGQYLIPVISGTPPFNGESTLTLAKPWNGVTLQNVELFVFPTFENMTKTVNSMNALNDITRGILSRFKAILESKTPKVDVQIGATSTIEVTPLGYLVEQAESLITQLNSLLGSTVAMTKAEFDTIRQNEIRSHVGSGVVTPDFDKDYEFKQVDGWQNKFKLKANEILIDGIWHKYPDTMIELHEAPNGLQNIDLSQPDYPDITAAIVAGGTSLSSSYLNQREIVIAVQKDIAVTAPNATNTVFIQDTDNHVYSDNGVLRQRVLSFVVERLPESVPCASKNNAWRDCKNAMSALGWTQTEIVGQWKREDKIAVALTWVQRRNQGAGHPLNPHGTRNCLRGSAGNQGSLWWYDSAIKVPQSFSDCFILGANDGSTGFARDTSGFIGTQLSRGRWNSDGKFYDAVHPSDAQDLRINANKVEDAKVLFDYSNSAVSSSLHGHESVPFTSVIISPSLTPQHVQWRLLADGTSNAYANNTVTPDLRVHVVGNRYRFHVDTGSAYTTIEGEFVEYTVGAGYQFRDSIVLSGDAAPSSDWNHVGNLRGLVLESEGDNHTSAFPTWTDIIGPPANIAAYATNLGVDGFYGNWIPDFTTGAPDRALNRKAFAVNGSMQYTDDNGGSWGNVASVRINNTLNVAQSINLPPTRMVLMHYITKSRFTEINMNVRRVTPWSSITAINSHAAAHIVSSLKNEISTGSEPTETLAITKIVSDVISHTVVTMTPDVKFCTAIGELDGQKFIMFNVDDGGVIDGSNIQVFALPYFSEEK